MTYGLSHIYLHWIAFAVICVMAATGLGYSYDLFGDGAMTVHQIAGQILIAVIAVRLINRVARPPVRTPVDHSRVEQTAARLVHIGLYVVVITYLVTGYVTASGESQSALLAPVSLTFARSDVGELFLETHFLLKWVLLSLVALHVAGALKHHLWDRDDTLTHMINFSRRG